MRRNRRKNRRSVRHQCEVSLRSKFIDTTETWREMGQEDMHMAVVEWAVMGDLPIRMMLKIASDLGMFPPRESR